MTADKRRFELVEGSSSKFWEVSIAGASFTVTYGRIGSPGVSKTTATPSSAEAAEEVAKLIREKLKKGYQEAGAAKPNFRPPPHMNANQHLERFLNYKVVVFNPDAEGGGDGERRELPTLRDLDKLVYFVGVGYDDADDAFASRLDALLADPKVGELRALLIGGWYTEYCDGPPTAAHERLIAHGNKLTALRGLFLGEVIQEEQEISWLKQSDCGPLLRALPQLEEFVVRGGEDLRFTELKHTNLRGLTVQSGGLDADVIRDILAADLPQLQRLTLWLGSDGYGASTSVEDLAPLFSGQLFPQLEHLGLQDSELADDLAAAVAKAPLLARLKGLDLSMGTLTDAGGEALLASPHVRSLQHLNLRYHYMSPEVTAKFRALGIEVNVADRQEADDPDDRFVEVSE